jgi:hypothetical protein
MVMGTKSNWNIVLPNPLITMAELLSKFRFDNLPIKVQIIKLPEITSIKINYGRR